MNMDCESDQRDATLSSLEVMMRREEKYQVGDYFATKRYLPSNDPVDHECRYKMCEWCYQMVEHLGYKRDTVAMTMSMLDRVLDSPSFGPRALADKGIFQLAAMSCFYTAVKINEQVAIGPNDIAVLSRGAYTKEEVEGMESNILLVLSWLVNPPTAADFIRMLVSLLPNYAVDKYTKQAILDLAELQAELTIADYYLVTAPPSLVAFSAVMNALDSLNLEPSLDWELRKYFSDIAHIDCNSDIVCTISNRLCELIGQEDSTTSSLCAALSRPKQGEASTAISQKAPIGSETSPRCVSA